MKIGTDQKMWVVVDPQPASGLSDVCFEVSLRELERMFRGGLTCEENPTLFTDGEEANANAHKRLLAREAAVAIVRQVDEAEGLEGVDRIQLLDAKGTVTLTLTLGKVR
jgi:hypothetical protein